MTDRKEPETLADDALDAVQGAGKVRLGDMMIMKHVDNAGTSQTVSAPEQGSDDIKT